MTLILAIQNDDHSILLSDRRITSGRRILSDDYSKTGLLYCTDGIFAYGFSGLAGVDHFKTNSWLLDTIMKAASPKCNHETVLQNLKTVLSNEYYRLPEIRRLRNKDKKLSIIFSGRFLTDHDIYGRTVILSNHEDFYKLQFYKTAQDKFSDYVITQNPLSSAPFTHVLPIGNWPSIKKKQVELIDNLLKENSHKNEIVANAIRIFRMAARSSASMGNIGKNIYEIYIPHDPRISPIGKYHTSIPIDRIWVPPLINVMDERPKFVPDFYFIAKKRVPNAGPWVVQKVKMNSLCPCGSRKIYRHCHGNKSRRKILTIKF